MLLTTPLNQGYSSFAGRVSAALSLSVRRTYKASLADDQGVNLGTQPVAERAIA